MTTLLSLIAPLMMLQSAGSAPVAIENDAPETWSLTYPRPLYRFVEEYRRCLTTTNRIISGEANFEMQHRLDLTKCEEVFEDKVANGYKRLQERGDFEDFDANDVREIFEDVGKIHIARGADLDQQFTYLMRTAQATQDTYEAERPKGLVLELRDASVVKARVDATANAADQSKGATGANN